MPIKLTTTTEGEKKRIKKKKKIQKNVQNKSKHKNDKCFSWVTAVRVLFLTGSHSLPHLPKIISSTVLISGPACEGSSDSNLVLFLCVLASNVHSVLLWEISVTFYIFHRHRVCLVDRVDLICSLYSCWEGFGSSSLTTLPLGFNCGFIYTSACGSSTGVCSWGCPGGLGFALVLARCGGGAAAWVAGV